MSPGEFSVVVEAVGIWTKLRPNDCASAEMWHDIPPVKRYIW